MKSPKHVHLQPRVSRREVQVYGPVSPDLHPPRPIVLLARDRGVHHGGRAGAAGRADGPAGPSAVAGVIALHEAA